MSNFARAWVERYSPYTGVDYQVHLAMGDVASDQTDPAHHFWMSMGKLARKIRRDRGSVTRSTAKIVADGYAILVDEAMKEKGGKLVPNGDTREYKLVFKKGLQPVYDAEARGGVPVPKGGAPRTTPPGDDGVVRSARRGGDSRARGSRVEHHKQKEQESTQLPPSPQGGTGQLLDPGPPTTSAAVRQVFDAWVASTGRSRTVLDAKRKRLIEKRLKDFPADDLIAAVEGWEYSQYHAGDNDEGKVWNELERCLRDAAYVEMFRDARHAGKKYKPRTKDGPAVTYR